MSITVPLEGFGGGSNPLNFKVVGNPQPENPKGNTIWLNTDTPITSYVFKATQPENPVEGMVWITTGTASSVEFNALKKNGIQVYPIFAKQCVGGAWVNVTAKTYRDDEWVDWWTGELYTPGNEWEHITGGWIAKSRIMNGTSAYVPTDPTLQKFSDYMRMKWASANKTRSGGIETVKTYDLTHFNTLYVDFENVTLTGPVNLCVSVLDPNAESYGNGFGSVAFWKSSDGGTDSARIPIDTLNGIYRVAIHFQQYTTESGAATADIVAARLEV